MTEEQPKTLKDVIEITSDKVEILLENQKKIDFLLSCHRNALHALESLPESVLSITVDALEQAHRNNNYHPWTAEKGLQYHSALLHNRGQIDLSRGEEDTVFIEVYCGLELHIPKHAKAAFVLPKVHRNSHVTVQFTDDNGMQYNFEIGALYLPTDIIDKQKISEEEQK